MANKDQLLAEVAQLICDNIDELAAYSIRHFFECYPHVDRSNVSAEHLHAWSLREFRNIVGPLLAGVALLALGALGDVERKGLIAWFKNNV